jgi:asparagine synthase (glutamine-hydrolysing)
MCGICGEISRNISRKENIFRMLKEMRHRGPDDKGTWEDEWLTLGHNRLSIIDLSEAGHQPMKRGDLLIVYNGEIYNYSELKEELIAKHKIVFKTKTDTEVILAAWETWGVKSLERFRGMWAFALYNSNNHQLILSRDRFGIKPMYYAKNKNKFSFSSEIKALLTDVTLDRKACMSVISDFILVGFQDHRAETFFEGINQLSPGHCLYLNVKDLTFSIMPYYDLKNRIEGKSSTIESFGDIFEKAIKIHLRSDVPVGTCLSGGLDSSSVATLAAGFYKTQSNDDFQAITAQSGDASNDETEFAELVVKNMKIKGHFVQPSGNDFRKSWELCLWHQEEPSASQSIFMQYWVMKKAHEIGLKVLLDGQGGDECLLGYERYYSSYFLYLLKRLLFANMFKEFRAASKNSKLSARDLILYFNYFLSSNVRKIVLKKRFNKYPPELMKETFSRIDESTKSYHQIQSMQISEIKFFQLPHLLKYEDRNSMAWSVEARLPFVDHEVVESALSLKPEDKIRSGYTKWALRQTMNNKMPDAITWRTNKIAFEAPTKRWISENIDWVMNILKGSRIIKELGIDIKTNNQNISDRIFNLAHWEQLYKIQI